MADWYVNEYESILSLIHETDYNNGDTTGKKTFGFDWDAAHEAADLDEHDVEPIDWRRLQAVTKVRQRSY